MAVSPLGLNGQKREIMVGSCVKTYVSKFSSVFSQLMWKKLYKTEMDRKGDNEGHMSKVFRIFYFLVVILLGSGKLYARSACTVYWKVNKAHCIVFPAVYSLTMGDYYTFLLPLVTLSSKNQFCLYQNYPKSVFFGQFSFALFSWAWLYLSITFWLLSWKKLSPLHRM